MGLSDEDDLQPGRILGPYELLIPVGSGGMAYVWAARHRQTQDIYALKMLRPHLAENVAFREMFFDEARLASRIRHENVAETFELVELDGILTLVMEWVDGSSLQRVLRPGSTSDREDRHAPRVALPIRHAVKIIAETCAGLHVAHDLLGEDGRPLSVVHRDVSPHNVLLTLDGRVKVTDFGVAKALGKLHMTIAGQVKGKLAYMSPEQLIGGGIDRRSDVFALGTVLYETTTGKKPFTGEHDPQIMSQIIMGHFPPPSEVSANYPPPLEKIIMKAMSTQAERRFATALQMRQALEGWLQTSGPPIGPRQISLLLYDRCGKELTERAAGVLSIPPPPPTSIPPVTQVIAGGGSASAPGTVTAAVTGPHPRIESGSSAMEVNRRSLAAPAGSDGKMSALLGALAVLVGVLLGLGVLLYVREARRERAAAAAALAAAADAGVPTPTVLTASTTAAPPIVAAGRDAGPTVIGDIDDDPLVRAGYVRLKVPDGARLYVDGQPLPPGVHLVSRPDAGEVNVLVKAEGRLDAIVTISPDSEPELEVTMKKKLRPVNPVSTVSMPPNPYD